METETATKELTITRTFDAPRELVWEAWTNAEHIQNWFSPGPLTIPVCKWNAEAGKQIYIEMKAPDGIIYPMDGEFKEIEHLEKIIFTSGALDKNGKRFFDILNTVTFIKEGDKTKLILHFIISNVTAEGEKYIAGQEMGWNMCLDKLVTLLTKI